MSQSVIEQGIKVFNPDDIPVPGNEAAPRLPAKEKYKRHSRNEHIFDGKRMFLSGSTTRDEKKWQSNIFENASTPQNVTRKLLGKKDAGKAGLYGDEANQYERKDEYNQNFLKGS